MKLKLAVAGVALLIAVAACQETVDTPDTPIEPVYAPVQFQINEIVDQIYIVGTPIVPTLLPPATGGNPPYAYSLTPTVPGLRFNSDTRTLTGTPDANAGAWSMAYRATDGGTTAVLNFTITVRALAPSPGPIGPISFGEQIISDQTYTEGTAIERLTLPAATGGRGALNYRLSTPPSGLSFDSRTRTLSGTPSGPAGAHRMTYTVTDGSTTETLRFTITVQSPEPPAQPIRWTVTVANQTYTVGQRIAALTLPVATGGRGTLNYRLSTPPSGLSFDSRTRALSGTPSGPAGAHRMTYTVTDGSTTETLRFTITVLASGRAKIYWATDGNILWHYLDTLPRQGGLRFLIGVGADSLRMYEGRLYWVRSSYTNPYTPWDYTLVRSDLDGANVEDAFTLGSSPAPNPGVSSIRLSLEAIHGGRVYWSEEMSPRDGRVGGRTKRSNLDGSGVELLSEMETVYQCHESHGYDPSASIWRSMVIYDGKMYWSATENAGGVINCGDRYGAIRRANLDGSSVETVLTVEQPPHSTAPRDIAVYGGKIYWTQGYDIFVADVDGSGVRKLLRSNSVKFGVTGAYSLIVHDGKLYWGADNSIERANLDGSGAEILVEYGGFPMGGIVIVP